MPKYVSPLLVKKHLWSELNKVNYFVYIYQGSTFDRIKVLYLCTRGIQFSGRKFAKCEFAKLKKEEIMSLIKEKRVDQDEMKVCKKFRKTKLEEARK